MKGPITQWIEKYYEEKLDRSPKKAKGGASKSRTIALGDTLTHEQGMSLMNGFSQKLN